MFKKIFIGVLLLLSIGSLFPSAIHYHSSTIKTSEGRSLTYHYLRLPNNGEPVVITHSLGMNAFEMMHWGKMFHRHGYDVYLFNVRGHGDGADTSSIIPYRPFDYSFDPMFKEDLPYFLSLVAQKNPQSAILLGHSMGGMLWERYLDGQGRNVDRKKIKCFIALGSPSDFSSFSPEVKKLISYSAKIISDRNLAIPIKIFSYPYLIGRLYGVISYQFLKYFGNGVLSMERWYKDLYFKRELTREALSHLHTDPFNSFFSWIFSGKFSSQDGMIDYGRSKQVYVPTLYFSGEKDSLGDADVIYESLKDFYPLETPLHLISFKSFAHLDFVFKKEVDDLSPIVLSFIDNPYTFDANKSIQLSPLRDEAIIKIDRVLLHSSPFTLK